MKVSLAFAAAAASVALIASSASAAVTFDPETGEGFVGKGDVQDAFGWNNKQLQDNASSVEFAVSLESVSSATWTCDRDAGPQTQERSNTTTTTTQGLVDSLARERNQITGFYLTGFGENSSMDSETDGPAVGSCPTGWSAIDLVEGEPVESGGLSVSIDGETWIPLAVPAEEVAE
jgi:hypothetical protein